MLVADFGHGLLTEKIRRVVEERASFLGLNCQTNSFNHGFNVINRQYRRANAFSLDQAELTLAVGERDMDFERELGRLRAAFGAKYAWLTRGGIETIGLGDEEACYCPALEVRIVDTIGAGDAFFALACLCAVRSLPVDFTTFVAQLAGAQAVRFAGNARPIEKASILKAGSTMLSI